MTNRKVVGWFYRNGKRIPIFEKSGSVDKRTGPEKSMAQAASYLNNRIKPQKSETKLPSKEADEKSRAYKGSDIAVEKYYDTYEPSVAKYKGIVGKRDKDGNFIGRKEQKGFLNEGEADRWGVGTISEDNRRSQLKENVRRLGKSERASRVKDIDFTTRMLDEEINERRKAKSRAFYQDSKNGRYYKDYDSPEAMNADIEKETANKGTSLITKEEIGPKREGRRLVASKGDSIAYDDNYIGVKPRPAEGKVTNRRRGLSTHNEGRGSTMYDVEAEGGKTRAVDGAAVTGIRKKGNLRTPAGKNLAEYKATRDMMAKGGALDEPATVMAISQKLQGFDKDNKSEMRRRMWGTPDVRGKRRSMYRLPQKKEFANVQPSESYIKYVMEEYGYNRADAIRFIKNRG